MQKETATPTAIKPDAAVSFFVFSYYLERLSLQGYDLVYVIVNLSFHHLNTT